MPNGWGPGFVPAHRRPRDPLRGAQLAPIQLVAPVVCATPKCGHPRLIHRDGGKCLNATCECLTYVETEGGQQ